MKRSLALVSALGSLGSLVYSFGYLYGMRMGMNLARGGMEPVRVYR